jgi:8-hydroxy-5-deazaflavin:NADPH oxidoreductase
MKVGIIGSGVVGQTLAKKFIDLGHEVVIGTRSPEKLADWAAQTGGTVGSFADAAAFGEIIVVSTLWAGGATENAINLADPANFVGKVVIDTTNPLDFSTGVLRLAVGHTDSAGEIIQRCLPGAHVVKAFNIVTAATMVNPSYTGGEPDMFIGGDDANAKQKVTQILHDFGWKGVIDLGGIETARYLEPLAVVWCLHYFATRNDRLAFKFVGK